MHSQHAIGQYIKDLKWQPVPLQDPTMVWAQVIVRRDKELVHARVWLRVLVCGGAAQGPDRSCWATGDGDKKV